MFRILVLDLWGVKGYVFNLRLMREHGRGIVPLQPQLALWDMAKYRYNT